MNEKIQIAVSACLLGHKVRYDAKVLPVCKQSQILKLLDMPGRQLEMIPFCPEVGIGLGVPRAKIQLVRNKDQQIRVVGVPDHTQDMTEAIESYTLDFLKYHPDISVYVVKSKSPSCGYQSTPLFEQSQNEINQVALTSGLFVQTIVKANPQLKIIEVQ